MNHNIDSLFLLSDAEPARAEQWPAPGSRAIVSQSDDRFKGYAGTLVKPLNDPPARRKGKPLSNSELSGAIR